MLSNIHTVRATYNPKSPKTWSFSPRVWLLSCCFTLLSVQLIRTFLKVLFGPMAVFWDVVLKLHKTSTRNPKWSHSIEPNHVHLQLNINLCVFAPDDRYPVHPPWWRLFSTLQLCISWPWDPLWTGSRLYQERKDGHTWTKTQVMVKRQVESHRKM